jgi:hypothetical protein
MPSRRHRAAMLVSPRSPSSTIRTLSSGKQFLRVTRRIVRTVASALSLYSAILPPFRCTKGGSVSWQTAPIVPFDLTTYTQAR